MGREVQVVSLRGDVPVHVDGAILHDVATNRLGVFERFADEVMAWTARPR